MTDKTVSGTEPEVSVAARSVLQAALKDPEKDPLRQHWDSGLSEEAVGRMWARVEKEPPSQRWGMGWVAAAAVALCAALTLANMAWLSEPGPLRARAGSASSLSSLSTTDLPRVVAFDDGSKIFLAEHTRVEPLSNEGKAFVTALRTGRARFSVVPGGPRKWLVEAGDVSVEVVGTEFVVTRSASGVLVEVQRGIVEVRGRVPGGAVRLLAGQSVRSTPRDQPEVRKALAPELAAKVPAVTLAQLDAAGEAEGDSDSSEPDSSEHAKLARATEVVLQPGGGAAETEVDPAGGSPRASSSSNLKQGRDKSDVAPGEVESSQAERWLEQADAARLAGQGEQARQLLLQVVRAAAPGDPRRGIAAMSLALGGHDAATVEGAITQTMGVMPAGLREAAWVKLLQARKQLGDEAGLLRAAQRYLDEYPRGSRTAQVKSLAGMQ